MIAALGTATYQARGGSWELHCTPADGSDLRHSRKATVPLWKLGQVYFKATFGDRMKAEEACDSSLCAQVLQSPAHHTTLVADPVAGRDLLNNFDWKPVEVGLFLAHMGLLASIFCGCLLVVAQLGFSSRFQYMCSCSLQTVSWVTSAPGPHVGFTCLRGIYPLQLTAVPWPLISSPSTCQGSMAWRNSMVTPS